MEVTSELIEKYFRDECTPDEAVLVSSYLRERPDMLEQHAGEHEYLMQQADHKLQTEKAAAIWNNIAATVKEQTPVHAMYKKWLVAASVAAVFIAALSFYTFYRKATGDDVTSVAMLTPDAPVVLTNESDTLRVFALKDGSVVKLAPSAMVEYPADFPAGGRTVKLQGRGFFEVAKNRNYRFAVEAGGLRTTALGTSFWVEVNDLLKTVQVQLVSGKVMVNAAADSTSAYFKQVYLVPGQELTYSHSDHQLLVKNDAAKRAVQSGSSVPGNGDASKQGALVFYKRPLKEVLNYLSEHYDTTVTFNDTQVEKMYFSGNFRSGTKLESILETIALLNNLVVHKTSSGFSIQ